jgi:predicted cupin superfamily sugar epimerase
MESRAKTDPGGDVIRMDDMRGPGAHGWRDAARDTDGHVSRNPMTSIFYLLTSSSPRQALIRNKSPHVHYWQGGGRLEYVLITDKGDVQKQVLGPNIAAGDTLQLICPSGYVKGSRLLDGAEWVLVGEAVSPGFDHRDMEMITKDELRALVNDDAFTDIASLAVGPPRVRETMFQHVPAVGL